jgi:aspartate dehydrogenase
LIRVGVIGLGTIGRKVCQAVDAGIPGIRLIGGTSRDRAKGETFLGALSSRTPFLTQASLIENADLVVEAATRAALIEFAPEVLRAGKDLMMLSCGALVGHEDWIDIARRNDCRILVPSGAIAGLDAVKGASVGRVDRVAMESRKAPAKWAGTPYVEKHGIDVASIVTETAIFEGTATEAVAGFPASVNILAALSLAGIGADRTTIRILATPGLQHNAHRITVVGEFGCLNVSIENAPSENPRTGRLAYLSAIAMLKDLGSTLRVGT